MYTYEYIHKKMHLLNCVNILKPKKEILILLN